MEPPLSKFDNLNILCSQTKNILEIKLLFKV